jgi:3-dehydroquinate synthase
LKTSQPITKLKNIKSSNYEIVFAQNGYAFLNILIQSQKYSKLFLITDTNSNELCSNRFLSEIATETTIEIIEFENGEINKNIATCLEIWNALSELGADRKSLIINLGGGVVTDLGGFVASTFKRGIDFINIPTTLLAMVDASIGGKNGVDLGHLKNQIGVINNPKLVLIDSEFLITLPQPEMRSGLAEMLKHGLIFDKNYWEQFLDLSKIDFTDFDQLIYDSIVIKNTIVMKDPTEIGIRKALNFGHTLGHAIESYFLENNNKTTLLHGEAIAVGMILESYISMKKNLISADDYKIIKRTLNNIFEKITFDENDLQPILNLLIHDKKNEYGMVQFALLKNIGEAILDQNAENKLIKEALDDYKN